MLITILIVVVLVLGLGLGLASWWLSRQVLHPKRQQNGSDAELEEAIHGRCGSACRVEMLETKSFDGLPLRGCWIVGPTGKPKAVVLAHGFGCHMEMMLRYAPMFLERGYQVLLFDFRNSGRSGGRATTMGFYERRDLHTMVELARARLGEDAIVGTLGESMGGATVLLQAAQDGRLSFVVSDCPYAELRQQLSHNLRTMYHVQPFPYLPLASLWARRTAGFWFGAVSPLKELKAGAAKDIPILFIHGAADDFIPPEATQALYAAKQGPKALWYCEAAKHAGSVETDGKKYRELVYAFLDEYVEGKKNI